MDLSSLGLATYSREWTNEQHEFDLTRVEPIVVAMHAHYNIAGYQVDYTEAGKSCGLAACIQLGFIHFSFGFQH